MLYFFGGMIIDLSECTMRLWSGSIANFALDKIDRLNVQIWQGLKFINIFKKHPLFSQRQIYILQLSKVFLASP